MTFPTTEPNAFSSSPAGVQVATAPAAEAAVGLEDSGAAAVATTRVLHVVNGEHYSGAERVQDLLAQQLPRFGYEVGFACVKPGRFPVVRQSTGAPLVELPMRGRLDLRVVKRLVQMIRDDGYELVHAHTPRTAVVGRLAAREAGVPLVYHVHSPAGRDSTRRLLNWANSWAEWAALRGATRLIAVSPSLRQYMIDRGFAAERIVYVPNGVPSVPCLAERRAPTGQWTIGTVALFRPRKGTEALLEALATLRSRGIDVRLRMVGGFETPAYESAIMCLAERLDLSEVIDWIGFTRKVGAELSKIDLFAMTSLFGEGLPMVVLESMAAGVPVVASRVDGIPEAVRHRETGLLVDPGSVSQLAAAIEEFVAGRADYTAVSRAARRRHDELFSDTAMADGVAAVYGEALGERR